jgi:hypothetical protein
VLLNQPSLSDLTPDPRSAGFDGVNDFVNIPRTVAGNFSLELWVNTTADSLTGIQAYQGNGLIWSDVAGTNNDFILAVLNNRAAFFTGNPDTTIIGSTLLNDGQWHHVVVTREQGVGKSLYVDGVLEAMGSTNNSPLGANRNINIGGNTIDHRYYKGLIDEVALYSYALSSSQVLAHYTAGFTAVPEPSSLFSATLGLGGLGGYVVARQRRRVAGAKSPCHGILPSGPEHATLCLGHTES